MGQSVLSYGQNLLERLENATQVENKNHYIKVQSVFYLDLLYVVLINIDQCFLNGPCRSNHIVCDSNFLKTFETEKKA